MTDLGRLREEYDAAVKRRHGKIGATGLEIRADALITALEAEVQRAKFQSYNELRQRAEQAEAEATEAWQKCREHEAEAAIRDRMLVAEYDSPTPKTAGYMRWLTDLRARAEKEAER